VRYFGRSPVCAMSSGMDKAGLRQAARARREAAHRAAPAATPIQFAKLFFAAVPVPPGATVAAYMRTEAEADPAPIVDELRRRGHVIAMPSVEGKGALVFRLFDDETRFVAGSYGIPMPSKSARSLDPDLLIVPLIAFDRSGHRLGYGAGYYDRTLEKLKKIKPILTVGLAYAVQEVDSIPHEAHDQPLDWIVTEKEAIKARR
jgi:5-formyltetrahydrofolate cyclo-ligase